MARDKRGRFQIEVNIFENVEGSGLPVIESLRTFSGEDLDKLVKEATEDLLQRAETFKDGVEVNG